MGARHGRAFLFVLAVFVLSAPTVGYAANKTSLELSRDSIIRIVTQIQRADYEGDRPSLKRLHDELAPIPEDNRLASRVLYWRGFALWRRAINGFNESPTPQDLEEDLTQAVTDFKDAIARDPAFVEPKIGAGSSLGYLMYLHKNDSTRVQELFQQSSPLLKEAMAAAPDNPRLLWVLGPMRWSSPPERGGGQDKAIEGYNRGLEAIRNQKRDARSLMGRTRVADECRVVESESNHAGFERRRAGRTGCTQNSPLLALRSRHSDAADSSCASQSPPHGCRLDFRANPEHVERQDRPVLLRTVESPYQCSAAEQRSG